MFVDPGDYRAEGVWGKCAGARNLALQVVRSWWVNAFVFARILLLLR